MRRFFSLMSGAVLVAAPVLAPHAATLYRCSGNGSTTYSGARVAGMSCSVVGQQRRASAARAAAPAPAVLTTPAAEPGTAAPAPVSAAPTQGDRRVSGQVYSYVRDGVRYLTSSAPQGMAAGSVKTIRYSFIERCFACNPASNINFGAIRLNTNAYRDEIAHAARTWGVEEALIRAIMHAESAYNPRALSRVGAQGLMQLMPATARRFGVSNAFDPAQNILGGAQYLAWLLRRYNGDVTRMAAGYNAGEGAVDRYGGVPPYRETRAYVQRVQTLAERYRSQAR